MPGKCLLVAGAGDVGGRLARLRAEAGDEVVALRRRPSGEPLPGIRALAVDLLSGAGLAQLPRSPDAVVFCAAPDAREEAAYRALFIDGAGRLLDALAGPPARLLFVSSTAVYGETAGERVDEDTPARPAAFNGRVLREAELAFAAACPGAVSFRPSGLYGPGRGALLRRALAAEAPGKRRWSNRLHVADAAAALSHLLDLERPRPIYLGNDDVPVMEYEVIDWLRRRHGLPALGGEAGPDSGRRIDNALLKASGWRPRYPDFRAGYGEMRVNG